QFTTANRVTFYNLREGTHIFSVKLADGNGGATTQTFTVMPTFTTEAEPNDDPTFANPLTTDAMMRGFNAVDGDVDWYLIDRAAGQFNQIDLHIERPAGVGQTIVSVFDVDAPQEGAVLSEIRADATTRQRAQLSLGFNERTNGFLVRVQAEGENPAAGYELSLALTHRDERSVMETERNDTPNFANPIFLPAAGFEIIGRADRSGDVDWYRLDVPSPTPRLLSIIFSTASEIHFPTVLLNVYAGTRVTPESQIGGLELTPANPGPSALKTAVTPGTYLLGVENAEGQSESTYRLRLRPDNIPAEVMWEIEPNGDRTGATPIAIDAQVQGTSWHPDDDLDWFRLPINQRGMLSLGLHRTDAPGIPLQIEMRLTDTSGVDVSRTNGSAHLSADVRPGTYFIELDPDAVDTTAEYTLTPLLIDSASHNGVDDVLGRGSELMVTLNWISGRSAAFRIESPDIRVAMIDEGDGAYIGKYAVPLGLQIDNGEIIIELGLQDSVWRNEIRLRDAVTIDTLSPQIAQVRHDAVQPNGEIQPVGVGQTVHINLTSETGGSGTFKIEKGNFRVFGDLFDDGVHDDELEADGIYGGSYTVRLGDNVTGATVTGTLTDRAGNVAERAARKTLTLDTEPPEIRSITFSVIRQGALIPGNGQTITLLAGDLLTVTLEGEVNGKAEFDLGETPSALPLFDDGTRGDRQSNDGLYTAEHIVRENDSATNAVITGRLTDEAGNTNEMTSPVLIDIDTTPPPIHTIAHNGTNRPFVAGDRLVIRLSGELGGTATFDIGNFKTGLIMVDDASGEDEVANDGIYTGLYEIVAGDNAPDVVITGHLVDTGGNRSVVRSGRRVTIDAVPPEAITGVTAVDRPNDQGNQLVVTWEVPSAVPDFARFHIYREAAPIRSTSGLIPISQNLVVREQATATITVPSNNFAYYIAVTAVDQADNESSLSIENGSAFGPIRAFDNLPPPSVVGVKAADKPDDNGKTLIVSWAPLAIGDQHAQQFDDFARYQIYVDSRPIKAVGNLTPALTLVDVNAIEAEVPVESDQMDFYVAVTAVDENDNRAPLELAPDGSVFGPVQSRDESPPDPILNVVAIDTPSDPGKSLTVGWTPQIDAGVSHYQVYLSELPIRNVEDLADIDPIRVEGEATDFTDILTPIDGVDFYIAIRAVDLSGNISDLDATGRTVDGPVQSVSNLIRSAAQTTITAGFDPKTKVTLPPNAAQDGQTIDIFLPSDEVLLAQIDEANHFLAEAHIDEQIDFEFQDSVREFVLAGAQSQPDQLARPAALTLSYPVETQTRIPPEVENDLRVFRLNTRGRVALWELVPGEQHVNREDKTVTSFTEQLGVFRVARLQLPNNLKDVVVFPNPFIPDQSASKQVTFLNLTANATIEIYTLNGERVRSITVQNSAGTATWGGRNDSGREVASGLYIYLIRSDLDKAVGRIMVMR
ncbi:MAG: T9SS type A sorting domain-containing protein, partial [Candidatus Poribacteria bacterium]|nr:T9SS type A sorting domain-containing protein [Candidatus Poribacteria bacterium]